jgi:hypothetical protein
MWGDIIEKLDQQQQDPETIDSDTEDFDDDDDGYDPTEFAEDEDDDF